MTGFRTLLIALLSMFAGIAANHGFSYDPSTLTDALLGLFAAIMMVMRLITKTPVGQKPTS